MTLRSRIMLLFAAIVVVCVALITTLSFADARRMFNHLQAERTQSFLEQFQRELNQRGQEIQNRVGTIARSNGVLQLAAQLSRPGIDTSVFLNEAGNINASQPLDFLSFVDSNGTIISSAHSPASFGYKDPLFVEERDWSKQASFIATRDLPGSTELALLTVAAVPFPGPKVYVVGGIRIDAGFLRSLTLPEGMALVLRRSVGQSSPLQSSSAALPVNDLTRQVDAVFAALRDNPERESVRVDASGSLPPQDASILPLKGIRGEELGTFLLLTSRQELSSLEATVVRNAVATGFIVLLISVVAAWIIARRITGPVEKLSSAADQIASGAWDTRVEIESNDEVGKLAAHFNQMTAELITQRDRLVQSERVAAWRELARRLAHELKNPLFPLQITVENLLRAREQYPDQFDEVFRESTSTMLAEIGNLKTIISRFSDFSKMPTPEMQRVDLNALVKDTVKLFEPQLPKTGKGISVKVELDAALSIIEADPVLLRRVFENLLLNAVDAMPNGGILILQTEQLSSSVAVEVSDTGTGIMEEEADRLFTPYYTTKKHGTGLGLAIAQSVISDHQGKISVRSKPGEGTTFRIELPVAQRSLTAGAHVE
jgi:two-component system, NtrC family, nitrogen regulation sensor histidine kinase NtrY